MERLAFIARWTPMWHPRAVTPQLQMFKCSGLDLTAVASFVLASSCSQLQLVLVRHGLHLRASSTSHAANSGGVRWRLDCGMVASV